MKTRTYLLLMLLAIVIPVVLLSILGLSMLLSFEREMRIRSIQELANATSLLIDSEIGKAEASLRLVANSRELRNDEFDELYKQLSATNTPLSWTLIADYEGNGLINTLVPYGTALTQNSGPWAARIFDSQQTQVGGYFLGSKSKRGVVSVNVPAPAASGKKYVVTQIFDPNYFNKVFRQTAINPSWIIGVSDADGISIARSKNAAQFVGKRVRSELFEATRVQASGVIKHPTREGIEVYDMFVKSRLTNWTVAIGVPVEEIESAARLTTWYVAIALVTVLGGALGLAVFFARRIDNALDDATAAARALAHGEITGISHSRLREADMLLRALHTTSLALSRESSARATLEVEREELLRSERAARLHAEAQDRAKDSFLSMLSHELRNPLAAISNAVSVIRFPKVPEANRERAWEIVSRQLAHLTHMVDDLLEVRRVLTGRVELQRSRLNVGELVRFCCDARIMGSEHQHHWAVIAADAWTMGDRARLMQVFDNLLANAVKYTPQGGEISVRCTAGEETITVEVSDTGQGMSASLIPTIFDSLVQGPTTIARTQGGLGLGLTIARSLVEMHGGTLTAASPGVGQGSTFTVQLPVLAEAGGAVSPDEQSRLRISEGG